MTGALGPRVDHGARHRVHDLLLGGVPVAVATAAPPPVGALSGAARRLAEDLAATRVGASRREVRVASLPSGRPVASAAAGPLPLSVSVSHVEGMVAAAVSAEGSVGVDVVDTDEVRPGLSHWLDDAQRRGPAAPALVWAAKEAAYKAAVLDVPFRPLAVAVEADGEGFVWRLRDRWREAAGTGTFLTVGRHVVAVACAAAGPGTAGGDA